LEQRGNDFDNKEINFLRVDFTAIEEEIDFPRVELIAIEEEIDLPVT
jgi:hypothetical protein